MPCFSSFAIFTIFLPYTIVAKMTSSQSVRLSALHSELQQLCIEIRSDSQPSRNKAVESLNSVLSNRKSDIIDCITNPEYGSSLNWSTLFNNAFEGIIKVQENLTMVYYYISMLTSYFSIQ